MKVSFAVPDASMPRTVYYDLLSAAVRRNPRFVAEPSAADICLPAEDIALETNWPRYGDPASAFLRGAFDGPRLDAYVNALRAFGAPLCVVNMHPFMRWPQLMAERPDILVADISLAGWERLLNPGTISMPALPITAGPGGVAPKSVLASFRGIASHPAAKACARSRTAQPSAANSSSAPTMRAGSTRPPGKTDPAYAALLATSIFAFVPRGDALFSYRLLEAMSYGCIPVILSDNWVPPFDRSVEWRAFALHHPESDIAALPQILRAFGPQRIAAIQTCVADTYRARFGGLDAIVETLLCEIEILMGARRGRDVRADATETGDEARL
jgi:hypothetical protein